MCSFPIPERRNGLLNQKENDRRVQNSNHRARPFFLLYTAPGRVRENEAYMSNSRADYCVAFWRKSWERYRWQICYRSRARTAVPVRKPVSREDQQFSDPGETHLPGKSLRKCTDKESIRKERWSDINKASSTITRSMHMWNRDTKLRGKGWCA